MQKSLIVILIFLFSISARAQTNLTATLPALSPQQQTAFAETNQLSVEVAKLFAAKKYDEALPLAEKAVKIAEANQLFEKNRAVNTLTNLAEIYIAKEREGDAAKLYESAFDYHQKSAAAGKKQAIMKAADRLAAIYYQRQNLERAEKYYLKALELREQIYGADNPQIIESLLNVGAFIRYSGKTEKAEPYYQRAVRISDQTYKPDDKNYGDAYSAYQCFVYQWKGAEEGGEYLKEFEQKRDIKYPRPEKPQDLVQSGVVNGKAIYLHKPNYPVEAKQIRASGVVQVEVTIDEQGKVIEAKTTCGYDVFAREAEKSAFKSKFSPTIINGQPVKVTGTLVYNFTAQ